MTSCRRHFLSLILIKVLIPLWVLAPKVTASVVFTSFENFGGWPTMGTACLVGQLAASSAFIGVDSAAHMSEEVRLSHTIFECAKKKC